MPITIPPDATFPSDPLYDVEFSEDPVFAFRILRKSSGAVVFDSSLGGMTLADQYLQLGIRVPTENIYGFGQNEHPNFKHDMNWKTWGTAFSILLSEHLDYFLTQPLNFRFRLAAMFATDRAPDPNLALYGVHPHYTAVEDDGQVHSVLFLNSNAQEVALTPAPGIVYRTIGGVIDVYIFMGPTAEDSVRQYTGAVGRHPLPPYWALGFHLCRKEKLSVPLLQIVKEYF